MKASAVRRSGMSVVTATVMALLLAGQAMAASWSSPTTFWVSGGDTWAWAGHLATLEPSTAIAVYQETHPTDGSSRIFARRSTDGGATWGSPMLLSRPNTAWSYKPHIAVHGQDVDVVWTEKDAGTQQSHIRYARSTDGGASFSSSVALSPHAYNYDAKVARGPGGRVAVAWYNEAKVRTLIRISTNGGASFAARQVVVNSVSQRHHALAVGDGVIYVAYTTWKDGIWLRRSLNDGASWSTAAQLTVGRTGRRGVTLAAEGTQAYLGFARKSSTGWTPSIRRTVDKGASWSGQVHLAVPGANAQPPIIALQGGIARSAFARCQNRGCDLRVFYRQSADGLDWTPAERVSPAGWATPFGVGYTGGKIVVGYEVYEAATDTYKIEVRTGTP
ncbi:MAG TPA: sialidase family protein [Candidatus Limnocylindrales bacterium]|nr:sialidase family protein [Candidatus Limnocylindrales bacterium]